MLRETSLESALRDLFEYGFVMNCKLDNYEVTSEEREAVGSISSTDILEGLKELLLTLLKFKRDFKPAKEKNYEKVIQMQKTELSNYERNQSILKEKVEFYKLKLEESENNYIQAVSKIKEMEEKAKNTSKDSQIHKRFISLNSNDRDFEKFSLEKRKERTQAQQEFHLEESDSQRNKTGIGFIKKKLEEKSEEIAKIQEKIREKINSRTNSTISPQPPRLPAHASENSEKNRKAPEVLSKHRGNSATHIEKVHSPYEVTEDTLKFAPNQADLASRRSNSGLRLKKSYN